MAKAKKKKFHINFILIPVLIILAVGGFYSYQEFQKSGIEQEGIVVCGADGTCEKSLHIHAALSVSVCGQKQSLSKDTGELADIHTHKESSLIHFHERLKTDREGNVLDWSPLKLSNAVEAISGQKLTDECIGDFCTGDRCTNGKPGKLSLSTVESFCSGTSCPSIDRAPAGKVQKNISDYVWSGGELLRLTFE